MRSLDKLGMTMNSFSLREKVRMRVNFYALTASSTAFCTWSRFSDWSKIVSA
jgi:hypothetical protein